MKKLSRILIIDDDPLTGNLHKRVIERCNVAHQVEIASGGEEALDLIKQCIEANNEDELPQLIFLDLAMPFMDGYQFLEAYQGLDFKQKDSVVVAVLTTSFLHKDKNRVKKYQIKDYIEKPLTPERMVELMEQHFGWQTSGSYKQ